MGGKWQSLGWLKIGLKTRVLGGGAKLKIFGQQSRNFGAKTPRFWGIKVEIFKAQSPRFWGKKSQDFLSGKTCGFYLKTGIYFA